MRRLASVEQGRAREHNQVLRCGNLVLAHDADGIDVIGGAGAFVPRALLALDRHDVIGERDFQLFGDCIHVHRR